MTETPKAKSSIITALDIGTTKVACIIARVGADGHPTVIGVGHQLSKGIKSGIITDVGEAEASIVAAVHTAEKMAGETVENVIVNVSGTNLKSRNVSVELEVSGESVEDEDISEIIHEGCSSLHNAEQNIVHCFPVHYYLDDAKGLRDPRGMVGDRLGAELHVVTGKTSFLKNLTHCVARCHLNIDEYVLSQHASALACLEPDEMDLGVTLIDMGGGVTSISVFTGGKNIFSDAIPVGGNHVTSDIARGLSTSMIHAERLKTLHASAVASAKDAEVMIDVPQLGEEDDEDEPNQMPRSMLTGVVRPRMEEIFEMVRSKLEAAGVDKVAGRRCVLTGGGSQMLGVSDLASRMLGKQVRKGKPAVIPGLAESITGPAFSTVIGMVHYATKRPWEDQVLAAPAKTGVAMRVEKLLGWFRENF